MTIDLRTLQADINDTGTFSNYFVLGEIDNYLTAGKNSVTLNGSNLLAPTSQVYFQVYDVNNNPLYIEIAKPASYNINYREGTSVVISILVDETTPFGNGQILIAGTTINNQVVKWTRTININPTLNNTSKIRFYNQPKINVDPIISNIVTFESFFNQNSSGICTSKAISPIQNTPYAFYDYIRKRVNYRIYLSSGNNFEYFMEGYPITFTNINGNNTSFTANVLEVISNQELTIDSPYIENGIVTNFNSANYQINYTPYSQLSSSFYAGAEVSGSTFLYKQSLANINFTNIRSFTGNPYRFKVYRKCLNSSFDNECIADNLIEANEVFVDESNPNRNIENVGYFYGYDHIQQYWFTSSNQLSYTYTSFPLIDGMSLTTTYTGSNSIYSRPYVISKDNSVDFNRNSTYYPYDPTQSLLSSGSSFDSNFIRLFANVEYIISTNIVGDKTNFDTTQESVLDFYLTGSLLSNNSSTQYDGYGINILKYTIPKGTTKQYSYDITSSFTLLQDVYCTMVLSPYNANFNISKISIKPNQQFSIAPDVFTLTVPFPIDIKNSRYLITAELFDVNSNHVPVKFETTQVFDPDGVTLLKPSSSISELPGYNLNVYSANFNNLNVSPGNTTLQNTIIGELTVENSSIFNGSVYISNGNALFTSSWSTNSVYAQTTNNAISSSYSSVSGITNSAISSSFASISNTASYVPYSSTWNIPNLLQLGSYYIWVSGSTSPKLRIKNGTPTSISDGFPVA